MTAHQRMSSWKVNTLASYLEQEDAEGLATLVRKNSVNGNDLLGLSENSCMDGLRCTPFAARKLILLRDKFLAM